jgi:hypothetical protein
MRGHRRGDDGCALVRHGVGPSYKAVAVSLVRSPACLRPAGDSSSRAVMYGGPVTSVLWHGLKPTSHASASAAHLHHDLRRCYPGHDGGGIKQSRCATAIALPLLQGREPTG